MFYPQLAPTGVSSKLGRPRPFNPDAAQALATALRRRIEGEVRFDTGSRALYATDGSNYRQVPIGVVIPKTLEDVIATVAVCREHRAPVLPRGGGTSLAGQCCNIAVVMDFSKYLNRILELDPRQQSAVANVLPRLNRRKTAGVVSLYFLPSQCTTFQKVKYSTLARWYSPYWCTGSIDTIRQ